MIYAFTSCALNYTPKSRALLESIREFAPDVKVCLALADEIGEFEDELLSQFDHVFPFKEIDELNSPGWIFNHRIVELATAIKPFVLRKILDYGDCEAVFYFDPDIVIFNDLEEMIDEVRNNDILLTPHLTEPEFTRRGIEDNELSALKHGTYNLGYIGVRNCEEGRRFADWWGARLKYYCRDEIPAGIFTDQKWIDLVPGFFNNVKILRHSGYNVASWNMTNREISKDKNGKYWVNDSPLVFYHFTGFDSGAHEVMSDIYSKGNPVVKDLISWYQKITNHLSKDKMAKIEWAFLNYNDGSAISSKEREVYRLRSDLHSAFPDPFETDTDQGATYKLWWDSTGKYEYGVEQETPKLLHVEGTEDSKAKLKSIPPYVRIPRGLYRFLISSAYRKAVIYLLRNTYRAWGLRGVFGLIFNK